MVSLLSPALLLAAAVGAQPAVWVTHATQKIRPADAPGGGQAAELQAARNEFEAVQVAIHGGTNGVTGVRATAPTLTGPGGVTVPAANVRLYRQGLITTRYASTMEVSTGAWPDPLIPDLDETANEKRNAFPFSVPAGENRALWVEILVPADAAPGEYRGALALTGDGGWGAIVPFLLTVWPFTLPSTASLASTFGQGWDGLCQAYYGGYSQCGGDAGVERTHQQLAAFMLDHRLTVDVVYTGPSGSGASYDWASWDAKYAPFFEGTAPTRLEGAKQTLIRYVWKGEQAKYAAWAKHFREKGWFDRTFDYTCDEPPATCAWSDINTRASAIHAADPGFRTLVTTTLTEASAQNVLHSIDILAPVINQMHDKSGTYGGSQRAKYDGFLAQGGKRLLWYQSCMSQGCGGEGAKSYSPYSTGWATVMIDAPAVRNRAMEWLSFLYGVSGELYWDTTYAFGRGNDPWTNQWYFAGNGDGTLFYPGTVAKIGGSTPVPVASLRLKMIREGMEDYEYLKLVSDLGDPGFALAQAARVAANPFSITADPGVLYEVRSALAQRIVELTRPRCSDGTAEGACAASRPLKCSGGALVAACEACGCPGELMCSAQGDCRPAAGPDAGTPGEDGGPPGADAGAPGEDAGQPGADAGNLGEDASVGGPEQPDASGPPGADAAEDDPPVPPEEPLDVSCQSVAGGPLALLGLLGLAVLRRRRR